MSCQIASGWEGADKRHVLWLGTPHFPQWSSGAAARHGARVFTTRAEADKRAREVHGVVVPVGAT